MKKHVILILVLSFSVFGILLFIENAFSAPDLKKELENQKNTPIAKHKIPLEVKEVVEDKEQISEIRAKIQEVTEEGKEQGIDQMTLKGKIIDSEETKKGKVINIIWQKAGFNKNEKEIEEEIEIPLQSRIGTVGKIEEGDKFVAKGDSGQLLEVWKKLKEKVTTNTKESVTNKDKTEDQSQNFISSTGRSVGFGTTAGGGSLLNNGQNTLPKDSIGFTSEETITTTDGCEIRIDLVNNLAIVQQRTLKGGEEITPCSDSSVTYAITADYGSCIDYIDYANGKVYKQYTLGYDNSDIGGRIQVQNCAPDYESSVDIVQDYDSCSYKHNFAEGYSVAQKRTIYSDGNNGEIILQSCHDDNTNKYLHVETEEGCSDKVEEGQVIWFTRKKITVKGKDIFITDCTPKETSIAIHDEKCQSSPYSHDFEAGLSYLNKNYFYYKNNIKVPLAECVKSEEMFEHKQELNDCKVVNYDDEKVTRIQYKTYIEDQGSKVYIRDCTPSNNPIAYTAIKNKWLKDSTVSGKFEIQSSTYIATEYVMGSSPSDSLCYSSDQQLKDVWILKSDGRILNKTYSDTSLKFNTNSFYVDFNVYKRICEFPIWCPQITTLYKQVIYQRYDGTEYADPNSRIDRIDVCGTGSLIANQESSI